MLKKMFLTVACVASLTVCAQESAEFTPKIVTWTYQITAKNAEQLSDILAMQTRTQETIHEMKRGISSDSFAKFLTFIKELQEAIFAGLNLFGVANINQQAVTQEEIALINAVEAVVQTVQAEQAQDQSATKRTAQLDETADVDSEFVALCDAQEAAQAEQTEETTTTTDATADEDGTFATDATTDDQATDVVEVQPAVPSIQIQIVFTMLKPEDMQKFQAAIEILNNLTESLNQQIATAQDLVDSLQNVSAILQDLQGSSYGAYFTLQG